jgi:hypothetical protein
VPVGNTNSVILSGTGAQVADLTRMLRQVDEFARAQFEKNRQAAGAPPEVKQPQSSN